MSGERDWRNAEDYRYAENLTRRDWAWEFLRRNEDYRRGWTEAHKAVLAETGGPNLTILTAHNMLSDMKRWGLVFRRCTDKIRQRSTRLLGSGLLSRRAASRRESGSRTRQWLACSDGAEGKEYHLPVDAGWHASSSAAVRSSERSTGR